MCNISEIIVQNKYGHLSVCKCGVYNVNFRNILFEFDQKELRSLRAYLLAVNIDYWEKKACNACSLQCRRIPIPTQQGNLILLFNSGEFTSFKNLVFAKEEDTHKLLSFKDIHKKFSLN